MTAAHFPLERLPDEFTPPRQCMGWTEGWTPSGCMDKLLNCGLHLTVSLSYYSFCLFLCVDFVAGIIIHSKLNKSPKYCVFTT